MRRHLSHALRGAVLSAILFVGSPDEAVGRSCAQLPDSVKELREVVVKGQRDRASSSTAPLHTFSTAKLDRFGLSDIGSAVKRLAGVNLRDYGGAGGLKTVSVRGLGAAHTAVVYDGVAVANSRSGEIDLSRFALEHLSSLSLTIGDNDDIFTTARIAASAAALNLSTMPAPDDSAFHLNAKLTAGSFGYVSPFARISGQLAPKWVASIQGSMMRADNAYTFALTNGGSVTTERRNNSRAFSANTEANIAFTPRPGTSLLTKLFYYDSDRKLPGPVVYYNDINAEQLRERSAFLQTRWRQTLGSHLAVMANAKFGWDASRYADTNGKYPGGKLQQNYYQREAYASGGLLWIPTRQWAVDYSADYGFNNLSSNLPTENHPLRHTILQSLTGRWRSDRLTVTGRLLGSIYLNSSRSGDAARNAYRLSPSVSASLRLMSEREVYIRLAYKNIFRVPTFNESYFYHYGSTNLRPENTDQLNLGLTWHASPSPLISSLTMTADGYLSRVDDKIVAIPYNMFVWTVVNLEKVRGAGADITLSADVVPSRRHTVTFASNYSYQRMEPRTPDSRDYSGCQVAYVPRHSGGASLSYDNPWVGVSANITATSARFATNENLPGTRIAGYADFSAGLFRGFALGRCRMEARIDILNLFNRQYEVIARYPMPRRSFRAAIKIDL